jgi:class 3 adenylate cyclase/tetratricopeptide (TPR) repeat protein
VTTRVGGGSVACSACGQPNRDGARFCGWCGVSLTRRCAGCGGELDPGLRFCDVCGAPAAASGSGGRGVSSELRKVVTVLFADLAGSTALHERMDPESARMVMQDYYGLVAEVIEAHDGRIVKFIGDGAMVVFGVPHTGEDDALRALKAALALHGRFSVLAVEVSRRYGTTVSLRAGVNTGEVVVSVSDDDVVGDAVNVAARLERACEPGGVLVGEATWRLTRGKAAFGDPRVLHVAGKVESVRAWTLATVDESVVVDPGTRLVGRGREMRLLCDAFDEVVRSGAAGLVTVLGSPGVGKTRLAAEFQREIGDAASVLVARCTQEAVAPLAPIAEMLTAVSGTAGSEPSVTAAQLGRFLGGDPDRERVERTLNALFAEGAGRTPEETLWAVRRLIEGRIADRPAVLVADDLQWGQAMLLELVEHLAEWTRGRLLLVVLARPELRDVRGSLTDGGRHRVVGLEGLDGEATARLACELLGAERLPDALVDRLPASTGGNPLFVRELVRMLADDEVLAARDDGVWELRVAAEAIDVPPTIQSLLAARLDRLSSDEQLVLERASVWGGEFPLGALMALLQPEIRLRAAPILDRLRRKELVESAGIYWIDEPVYRFHHVLIRDAAYRRLLRDVRAGLHERLAEWVEAKTASVDADFDELVGHHLEQAYIQRRELAPVDHDAISLGRAASARLAAAARRALDRDDPAAALLSARALACLPAGDAERAELLLVRCDALLAAADATAARDAVAELAALGSGWPRLRAWSDCFAAQLATIVDLTRLRETEQRAQAVAAELAELGDVRGAAKAHAVHAGALARLGRFAEVEEALDRALTAARQASDRRLATVALAAAPVAAVWGPSPVPRAGGRCLDVVRLLRITAGSPVVEATSLRCQAVLEAFRGRFDTARRLIVSAREMVQELGLVHGLLEADLFAGIVEVTAGDLDAARTWLKQALEGFRQLGADADTARAAALLARVVLEEGQVEDADRLAGEAERLAGHDLQAGIAWRRVQAEILIRQGRPHEALKVAEAAVEIAGRTDALVQHADACLGLAAALRALGDHPGAAQAVSHAADLYDRKGASALAVSARGSQSGPFPALPAPAASLRGGSLTNAAVDAWRGLGQIFADRDWASLPSVLAEDSRTEDRRPVTRASLDPGAARRYMRLMADQGGASFDYRALAIRGDRLALLVTDVARHSDGSEFFSAGALDVVEVGEDGRIIQTVLYPLKDTDGAFSDLEQRYIESEGAPYSEILTLAAQTVRAFNARDWSAYGLCLADNLITHDHYGGGLGDHHGRDSALESARLIVEQMPQVRWSIPVIHEVTADAMLATLQFSDAASEFPIYGVAHCSHGSFDRLEVFGAQQFAEARAAFRHLTAPPADTGPSNRCTEAQARLAECVLAGDTDALAALFTRGYLSDEHRPGLFSDEAGVFTTVRAAMQLGITEASYEAVAVRGQQLALGRFVLRGWRQDGGENLNVMLVVQHLDDDGRFCWGATFDEDRLADAIATLEHRYRGGAGTPQPETLPPGTEDQARSPTRVAQLQSLDSQLVPPNRAWEAVQRSQAAIERGDRAAFDALHSPALAIDDRRRNVQLETTGTDSVAAGQFSDEVTATQTLLATRGETLVLNHGTWQARRSDGFEAEYEVVNVSQIDQAGLITSSVVFDGDDLDGAYRQLDRQYLDLLDQRDSALAGVWASVCQYSDAFNRRAWTSFNKSVADDFTMVDHRVASFGTVTGAVAKALRDAVVDVSPVLRQRFVHIAEIGPFGVLCLANSEGAVAPEPGGNYDKPAWMVIWVKDGRVSRHEVFALEGETEARARFVALQHAAGDPAGSPHAAGGATRSHERTAADATAQPARQASDAKLPGALVAGGPPLPAENACVRLQRALNEAFARRDWNSISQLQHESVVFDDRRPSVATRVVGRDAYLRPALMALVDRGVDSLAWHVKAVRGACLALLSFEGPPGDGSAVGRVLAVSEVDPDGLLYSCAVFEDGDIDQATAELDRRYLEGEGAPFSEIVRLATEQLRAANAGDWQAVGACFAPQVVIHDHYWGGLAEIRGRDQAVDAVRTVSIEQPDARWTVRAIHEPSQDAIVVTIQITGGNAEVLYNNVNHRGPEGIDHVDIFGPDNLYAAIAARRRLTAGSAELSNRCTEVWARSASLFADRDWDAMRQLATENAVYDDRRPVVRTTSTRSDSRAHARELAGQGVQRITTTVLAIRGERLALVRLRAGSTDPSVGPFVSESLSVIEIDDSGLLDADIGFVAGDLDAAMAELDHRYMEGEGSPYDSVLTLVLGGNQAINGHKWESLRFCLALGVIMHDHQWTLREATGRDAVEEVARQGMAAIPGSHLTVRRILALSDHAAAAEVVLWCDDDREWADAPFLQVVHVGPEGIDRIETFGSDAVDDALSCYRRFAGPLIGTLSNRCIETLQRAAEHFATRNWDAFTAIMSDEYVNEDHRTLIGVGTVGRSEVVAGLQYQAEQGADRLQFTPFAVRGANLALIRTGTQSSADADDSFASVTLAVLSCTDDGLLDRISVYDLAEEDRAIAELDRRYLEGEGAPYALLLSAALAHVRAINARDWDALLACYSANVIALDHQWGIAEARGREEAKEVVRRAMDAVPGSRLLVRRTLAVSSGAVTLELMLSQDAFGYTCFPQVAHVGQSGIDRVETFGPDGLDDALACYRRMAAAAIDIPSNSCVETLQRAAHSFASRDWETYRATISDGFVYEDHRRVMRTDAAGRDEVVAGMRIAAEEEGADRLVFTPIAVRGSHLALVQAGFQSDTDADDSLMIAVFENTDEGQIVSLTVYDLDDQDAAIDELERRYIEGEGAPTSEMLSLVMAGTRAFNQRDWDRLSIHMSPYVADVEHYSGRWGSNDGVDEALPDARSTVREIHACTTDALLCTTLISGRSPDGGAAQLVFHNVYHRTGQVVDHMESFGAGNLDQARAAYRQLVADTTTPNRCIEAFRRFADRFAARDWYGLDALLTDDYVYVDHRPVVGLREVGREKGRRTMQILAEQGGDRVVYSILATRGDRHALLRLGVQSNQDGDDSFASVMLGVVATSPDDRFASTTVFGLEDEDRARAELERQYEHSEIAPYNL